MKLFRVELVYPIPKSRIETMDYPERLTPRAVRLIDEDDNAFEVKGVKQASISFGLADARVLNLSIIVRAVDEVYENDQRDGPDPLRVDEVGEDAVKSGSTEP